MLELLIENLSTVLWILVPVGAWVLFGAVVAYIGQYCDRKREEKEPDFNE